MARGRRPSPTVLRGLLHPAHGPLVRAELRGGTTGASLEGLAVIDTGASMSAVDRGAALELGLETFGAASWFAVTGGERPVAPLRRAQMRLGEGSIYWELDLIEVAGLDESVAGYRALLLIGWDFLRTCQLHVDGPAGTWSLQLPAVRGPARRRR